MTIKNWSAPFRHLFLRRNKMPAQRQKRNNGTTKISTPLPKPSLGNRLASFVGKALVQLLDCFCIKIKDAKSFDGRIAQYIGFHRSKRLCWIRNHLRTIKKDADDAYTRGPVKIRRKSAYFGFNMSCLICFRKKLSVMKDENLIHTLDDSLSSLGRIVVSSKSLACHSTDKREKSFVFPIPFS